MMHFILVAIVTLALPNGHVIGHSRVIVDTGLTQADCQRESIYPPVQILNATYSCELTNG